MIEPQNCEDRYFGHECGHLINHDDRHVCVCGVSWARATAPVHRSSARAAREGLLFAEGWSDYELGSLEPMRQERSYLDGFSAAGDELHAEVFAADEGALGPSHLKQVQDVVNEHDEGVGIETEQVEPVGDAGEQEQGGVGHVGTDAATHWTPTASPVLSPDCRDGKCRACTGDAWDLEVDEAASCECGCHEAGGDGDA